ncbi:unnamed protein product, partial [marine sediment metagenome]
LPGDMVSSLNVSLAKTPRGKGIDADARANADGDNQYMVRQDNSQRSDGLIPQPGHPEGINNIIKSHGYH